MFQCSITNRTAWSCTVQYGISGTTTFTQSHLHRLDLDLLLHLLLLRLSFPQIKIEKKIKSTCTGGKRHIYIYIIYGVHPSSELRIFFLGLARTRSSFQRDWVSILCLSSLSFTTISRYNFGRVYLIFLFFWKKIKFYSILLLHPFLALTVLLVEMGWLWWW